MILSSFSGLSPEEADFKNYVGTYNGTGWTDPYSNETEIIYVNNTEYVNVTETVYVTEYVYINNCTNDCIAEDNDTQGCVFLCDTNDSCVEYGACALPCGLI